MIKNFLQPWITPSLFDNTGNPMIIDEWTFCQYQDRDLATATLQTHWDTWITQVDFAAIAAAGYASPIYVQWLLFNFVLISALTTSVCRLDIGHSTLRMANRSSKDKLITFGRQSVGRKLTASK